MDEQYSFPSGINVEVWSNGSRMEAANSDQKQSECLCQNDTKPVFDNSSNRQETYTLKQCMTRFGMPNLLRELEESLNHVRRKKIEKEKHEQRLKTALKKLAKKSLKIHPDVAVNMGQSEEEVAIAQNVQSALNATRSVLKMLTDEFLENLHIDYEYGYFANLDIRLLASEAEIEHRISNLFSKISQLSEIKRMNIIGEIRNFLLESEKCQLSYLENDISEFKKRIDFVLYHLHNCITGYEKLLKECEFLEKESRAQNDESLRRVILKVNEKSLGELQQLQNLEKTARHSLQGCFTFFNPLKPMNEYFVQPFVYHLNALLMSHVLLERNHYRILHPRFRIPCFGGHSCDPYLEKEPTLYADAYHLAYFYQSIRGKFETEVRKLLKNSYYEIKIDDVKEKFYENFQMIQLFLMSEFKTDAYSEGVSNRTLHIEKLFVLRKTMESMEEERKQMREEITACNELIREISRKFQQDTEKNEEVEKEKVENFPISLCATVKQDLQTPNNTELCEEKIENKCNGKSEGKKSVRDEGMRGEINLEKVDNGKESILLTTKTSENIQMHQTGSYRRDREECTTRFVSDSGVGQFSVTNEQLKTGGDERTKEKSQENVLQAKKGDYSGFPLVEKK